MGYRSDVYIGISKEVKAWALINENWPSILNDADETSEEYNATFYDYRGWKWYESYPEIAKLSDFFAAIDEQFQTDTSYAFVRLGEEYEDIEVSGQPWEFGIEVHRTIERYSR